jgi:nucleotide-binding universal stress UspA family protein
MALKNIGVFVDATPEGEKRADYAAMLAHQCGAHLAGIHVVSAARPEHPADSFVVGERAISATLAWQKSADQAVTATVRQRFEAISAKHEVSAEFRVIGRDGPGEDLILGSLHSDLVVIGQRELHELPGYLSAERLLLASGTPILVVPNGWTKPIGQKILVGWNASREARRAIADALPFLVAAPSMKLLVIDASKRADRHGEEPGADIALYLARHGAHVEVEQAASHGSPLADVILSYAADHGMDLIVIGAYSSRARSIEVMFGGVTRTLLKQAPVPLLMSR